MYPDRNGFSVAQWEGDSLVVETTNLKEMLAQTYAHSDQAKIIERYSLTEEKGEKVLVMDMTLTDPLFYTQPVNTQKKWQSAQGRLLPYECNEVSWLLHLDELKALQTKQ